MAFRCAIVPLVHQTISVMQYKYRLEKYKGRQSRFICPRCKDKEKTFTKYINTHTNQYISDEVGRCGREIKCGYHYSPAQYFKKYGKEDEFRIESSVFEKGKKNIVPPISFISEEVFLKTLIKGKTNYFIDALYLRFGSERVNEAVDRYRIGTSKKWRGATVFWQIDFEGRVRSGKIMLFEVVKCKRKKVIGWAHSELNLKNFVLNQCFFGEHLLVDDKRIVALVESQKTAVIASIVWPQFIWIATGGIHELKLDRCKYLSGRDVIVFPDAGAYDIWVKKIESFSMIANFRVSKFLEQHVSIEQRAKGWDLADCLLECESPMNLDEVIKLDSKKENIAPIELIRLDLPIKEEKMDIPEVSKSESWEGSYEELYSFFFNKKFLEKEIQLDACTKISDVELFIESHLKILKLHWNNRVFKPFLDRLLLLQTILSMF